MGTELRWKPINLKVIAMQIRTFLKLGKWPKLLVYLDLNNLWTFLLYQIGRVQVELTGLVWLKTFDFYWKLSYCEDKGWIVPHIKNSRDILSGYRNAWSISLCKDRTDLHPALSGLLPFKVLSIVRIILELYQKFSCFPLADAAIAT